tara:strand:- start:9032 stop:9418 length:387 start_codon:yes stop_codon:yes gene_type:complete
MDILENYIDFTLEQNLLSEINTNHFIYDIDIFKPTQIYKYQFPEYIKSIISKFNLNTCIVHKLNNNDNVIENLHSFDVFIALNSSETLFVDDNPIFLEQKSCIKLSNHKKIMIKPKKRNYTFYLIHFF